MNASPIANPQNYWDELCNIGIKILHNFSQLTGLSYEALNVWLFLIIQPLTIFLLFSFTLVNMYRYRNDRSRNPFFTPVNILSILCWILLLSILAKLALPFIGKSTEMIFPEVVTRMEKISRTHALITYGELNILLFVIIQPSLILFFLFTTIKFHIQCSNNRKADHSTGKINPILYILTYSGIISTIAFYLSILFYSQAF